MLDNFFFFLQNCQVYEGDVDNFNKGNENGKAVLIVGLRYYLQRNHCLPLKKVLVT